MMSRKHFRAIAKILKEHNANEDLINAMASFCKGENYAFDFNKFADASLSDNQKIAEQLQE